MNSLSLTTLDKDTIAAIATAPGRGGIGVIRLSGQAALNIAQALTGRTALTPRHAHFAEFRDATGLPLDDGLVLFFPGPRSFTGEDVVELQGHGGPVVLNRVLQRCLELGARQARAGEFSERAFLNDKLDLVQAEAIADLINAQTETAARQAQASLRGAFSTAIEDIRKQLVELRKYVEAAIDFPEEEIDFLSEGKVAAQLSSLLTAAKQLHQDARQGAIIRSGATVVLAGRPNAGKSSLLNALAGDQIAIVTDLPGTTRDIVREYIEIDGVPVHLTDTAGLRDSEDVIEQEGIRRAHHAIAQADLTLQMLDDTDPDIPEALEVTGPLLRVFNKIDLSGRAAGTVLANHAEDSTAPPTTHSTTTNRTPAAADRVQCVAISTRTGAGISELKAAILQLIGIDSGNDTLFSARERHIVALEACLSTLTSGEQQFLTTGAGELLAEDLRRAHDQLGEITGKMTSDALLGEIFSSFCIGK